MINPYEHDESPIEDETSFPCACGDDTCLGDNTNPHDLRIGSSWYAADCPMGNQLEKVIDGRMRQLTADERRDDRRDDR